MLGREVRMLPSDWDIVDLNRCAEVLTGFAFPSDSYVEPSPFSIRLLRGDNIVPGSLRWDGAKYFPNQYGENLKRYEMHEGDIVIALDRPIVGSGLKCSPVEADDLPCLLVQRVARLRAKPTIDQRYLFQSLQTGRFVNHLLNNKTESAVPHVSPNDIRSYTIPLPILSEQSRIADVLLTWDKAAAATGKLLINSHKQKQALVQQSFSTITHKYRASEIFAPRSMRGNGGLELLSVMQDVGVVPRRLLDRKVVMPDGSTEAYKLVEPGDFVISLRSFEGGLEYSKFKGLVSPAYTVLKSRMAICDDYFRHYFKSREFIGRLAVAVIGIRDGKQISYGDFSFIKLPCPDIEEQQRIAAVLNQSETLIEALQRQLEKLRAEKRALMQQLLTGKQRVRIDGPLKEASAA